MKKKLLVLMMLVFSLTACNADKDKAQEPQKTEQTQEQAKTDENKTEEKTRHGQTKNLSLVYNLFSAPFFGAFYPFALHIDQKR
mgnify:CR=1 FL=1